VKAYVIGFANRHRNPRLTEQLQSAGFDVVETNGAVDAKTLDVTELVDISLFEAVVGRYPLPTEVGCATAHLNAWKYLIDQNLEKLAVFEDDAILLDFDLNRANESISKLKGPWYIALERRAGDFLVSHLRIRRPFSLRRAIVQPRGSGAYIISRQAAIVGVRNQLSTGQFDGISDNWPGPATMFKFFVCLPPAFKVDPKAVSIIGVKRSRQFSRAEMFLKVAKVLVSPSWGARKKLGLLQLKVLRALKYLGSVHFLTAWYLIRFGSRR
jgi:hypothetical protein